MKMRTTFGACMDPTYHLKIQKLSRMNELVQGMYLECHMLGIVENLLYNHGCQPNPSATHL